jgi:hypothetical protein
MEHPYLITTFSLTLEHSDSQQVLEPNGHRKMGSTTLWV